MQHITLPVEKSQVDIIYRFNLLDLVGIFTADQQDVGPFPLA